MHNTLKMVVEFVHADRVNHTTVIVVDTLKTASALRALFLEHNPAVVAERSSNAAKIVAMRVTQTAALPASVKAVTLAQVRSTQKELKAQTVLDPAASVCYTTILDEHQICSDTKDALMSLGVLFESIYNTSTAIQCSAELEAAGFEMLV